MGGKEKLSISVNGIVELEKWLEVNGIAKEDICLMGSCALSARGLRQNNDLEFAIDPKIRKQHKLQRNIYFITYAVNVAENVELWWNQLYRVGITDNRIFRERLYDVISGYNVIYLDIERLYKEDVGREKDWEDIRNIDTYIHDIKYGKNLKDRIYRGLFWGLQLVEYIGTLLIHKVRKKCGIEITNSFDEVHLHLWW